VRQVRDRASLTALAREWDREDVFRRRRAVQAPAVGPLVMVQSVFADGQMIASHTNPRVREGASGGASHKRSINLPDVRDQMAMPGARLGWREALSADVILLTDTGPVYIDINPRLVEPGNAWRAGVDLAGALIEVTRRINAETLPQISLLLVVDPVRQLRLSSRGIVVAALLFEEDDDRVLVDLHRCTFRVDGRPWLYPEAGLIAPAWLFQPEA
jgi:hypothetical protein